MTGWKLKRTTQCQKCPWRVAVNPYHIPNGYDPERHRALATTIAEPGSLRDTGRVFACHELDEAHCIGWLSHQLGPGNNIPLRIRMISCENAKKIRLRGKQHERFEDTLPAEPDQPDTFQPISTVVDKIVARAAAVRNGEKP